MSIQPRAALALAAILALMLVQGLPVVALDDATQTAALDRLDGYLDAHPGEFGVLWYDSASGEAVVQVTEAVDEAERAELVDLAEPLAIRFDRVAHPSAEIEAVEAAIGRLMRRDDPRVAGIRGLGVELSDLRAGRNVLAVKVAPARLEAVRAYLVERWGEDLFRFAAGGLDQNAGAEPASCGPAEAPVMLDDAFVPADAQTASPLYDPILPGEDAEAVSSPIPAVSARLLMGIEGYELRHQVGSDSAVVSYYSRDPISPGDTLVDLMAAGGIMIVERASSGVDLATRVSRAVGGEATMVPVGSSLAVIDHGDELAPGVRPYYLFWTDRGTDWVLVAGAEDPVVAIQAARSLACQ